MTSFTACQARLISIFSIIRLELLVYSQANDASFSTWALKLQSKLTTHPDLFSKMERIIERGVDEENFLTREIRLNALSSAILN